jgi:hypothetical protein
MFNFPVHKRNANQKYGKIFPHPNYNHQEHKQQLLERIGKTGTLKHCTGRCKLVQPLWKAYGVSLKNKK